MKKLWDNIILFGERKNLVHVCNSVANLAEGFPLVGNGNISHSDHIRAIKKILPTKSPILSDFFHTHKPKFECQKP